MYRIEFDIVALFICLVTFFVFHKQKQMASKRNDIFYTIIIVISLSTLFSILSSLAFNHLDKVSIFWASSANIIYLIFQTNIPFLFCIYVFILTGFRLPNIFIRILFSIPWVFYYILILGNPFHHLLFYFENNNYYRGPLHLALYAISLFYLIIMLHTLFKRHKKISFVDFSSFVISLFLPLIAIIFQFFLRGIILECFAFSISALFLLLIVQNDRNLIESITGLQNNFAFTTVLRDRLLQKTPFAITLVHSREFKSLQFYLDNNSYNNILIQISSWLESITKKRFQLFILSENVFAFVSSKFVKKEMLGELSLEIIHRSQEPWFLGDVEIKLAFQAATLRIPEDCKTANQIRDYIEQFTFLTELYSDRHIIYAKDFISENHLRQARIAYALQAKMENRSLDILYQAIYSTQEKRTYALESLINLNLPDGSNAHQSEVLKIAERIGLGKRLGELIMEESFAWYLSHKLYEKNIKLQIRLLESFCLELDWAHTIIKLADKMKMDLSYLCLQITETAITNNLINIKQNMNILIEKKVLFALDDYGSGYTDFSEILDMPFGLVKLDKIIVQAAFKNSLGAKLLEGTVSLFKQLNWPIVAEGVESKAQLQYLENLDLHFFQGYYIGYPEIGKKILSALEKESI